MIKRLIKRFFKFFKDKVLIKKLEKAVRLGNPLKVVIGASGIIQKGWLGTEMEFLNILNLADWQRFFMPNSIDIVIAEHVWEHLSSSDGNVALQNCFTYLKPGGYLRIAVPDGFHTSKAYIEMVRPGGYGAGADDHKILYTYQTLSTVLEMAGFKCRLLEYFDENGQFHYNDWLKESGLVRRSKYFDSRNTNGSLTYTSIIIDGIK